MANKQKENSDNSNSKKRIKKDRIVAKEAENESADGVPKFEQIKLDHILKQALQRFKAEELAEKKSKITEIKHLANIIEEYLSGFILLGYTVQGEKVSLFSAENSKDEAAVVDLLRSTFFDITSNRP